MAQRLDLQAYLEFILGSRNVYFQPPPNIEMKFPAIVYQRDRAETTHADNVVYRHTKCYQVTLIDEDPDSPVYDKIAAMPLCLFTRHFATEGLNHDIFSLYF